MSAARVVALQPNRNARRRRAARAMAKAKAKEAARVPLPVVGLHSLTSIFAVCEANQSLRFGMLMTFRVRTDACG
jgi:hypothetical protein